MFVFTGKLFEITKKYWSFGCLNRIISSHCFFVSCFMKFKTNVCLKHSGTTEIFEINVQIKIENCHYDAFKMIFCVICRSRVFISLLLTSSVVAFVYYKLPVNIDGVIAIDISEQRKKN